MTFADIIISWFYPLIVAALFLGSYAQAYLGNGQDWIERTRSNVLRAVNPIASKLGRTTVSEAPIDDHIMTVEMSGEAFEERISEVFDRNLFATKKYRVLGDQKQWTGSSWVFKDGHMAETQYHVYYFEGPLGTVDIYAHREANITDPSEHHGGDGLVRGDPDGTVKSKLEEVGVGYDT